MFSISALTYPILAQLSPDLSNLIYPAIAALVSLGAGKLRKKVPERHRRWLLPLIHVGGTIGITTGAQYAGLPGNELSTAWAAGLGLTFSIASQGIYDKKREGVRKAPSMRPQSPVVDDTGRRLPSSLAAKKAHHPRGRGVEEYGSKD